MKTAIIICLLSWIFFYQGRAQASTSTDSNTPSTSYYLPVIAKAADGMVLNTAKQPTALYQLMGNKIVLLSFIYASCSDVNGCPLATLTLQKLARHLQQQPELADKLRILTLSFNPLDTPEVMQHYGEHLQHLGIDWQFLSPHSDQQLQTILQAYQQTNEKIYDAQGQFTGSFAHILRVYLIDQQHDIRNIYNVDSLQIKQLLNDIQNIITQPEQASPTLSNNQDVKYRAGDDKSNYQNTDYQTHSIALAQRTGKASNLMRFAQRPPLGLPKATSQEFALSPAKIALGRKLFYDRRLSFNNTFSCANCHIPEQGFSNNELTTPIGVEGRSIRRNSPSLYNVGSAQLLFHDGRENSLAQQAWGPLLAHNEMANPAIATVVDKIKQFADYRGLFEQAFKRGANMETIGLALASYQRCLNSGDSAFDRWYYGKQANVLSTEAQRGFKLFTGKAGCQQCHIINKHFALFSDQQRHNTGIGYAASMHSNADKQRLQLAPGVFIDVDSQQINAVSEAKANDLGYYEISQNPKDLWVYKTPSLRNVALSQPYMHNGSLSSLPAVLEFYNQGGIANGHLSPLIKPLGLTETEKLDLQAFLESLTGSNVGDLVGDGFAAVAGE